MAEVGHRIPRFESNEPPAAADLFDGVVYADREGCREDEGHSPGKLAQDGRYENLKFCHLDLSQ